MRGLTAQYSAPAVVALIIVALGAAFNSLVLGFVAGAAAGTLVAIALGRRARHRLWAVERAATDAAQAAEAAAALNDMDELDHVLRVVADRALAVERRHDADREHLRQQALVLDRMNDGLMRVNESSVVVYANVAAGTLFGGRNPTGRTFMSVTRDHELNAALRRCLELGEDQNHTFEIAGEGRLVSSVLVRLHAQPSEVLVMLRDITEVNRLQNLRRDFVANVSHELRTPLSTIKILTETLLDLRAEDEEAAVFLHKIDGEVDSMTALVRDLLDLTRLEALGARLTLRSTDAVQLLQDVCDRMRPIAERHDIELGIVAGPETLTVVADERRLHQALINLISNAVVHTRAGGTVTLSAARDGDEVRLSVSDTGSGIPADDLPRIWERFFKSDRARSGPGTGLGLAIVKHIAQAHNGTVAATSVLGQGSEFSITLPSGPPIPVRREPRTESYYVPS